MPTLDEDDIDIADDTRARYKVLEKSFIGHNLVEPGQEVTYDGHPGDNLHPLNAKAKAAKAKAPGVIAQAERDLAIASAPVQATIALSPQVTQAEIDRHVNAALARQAQDHAAEISRLQAQAAQPKQTGSPDPNDPNKDPTLVARGGETEAADPVDKSRLGDDPNAALTPAQRAAVAQAAGKTNTAKPAVATDANDLA